MANYTIYEGVVNTTKGNAPSLDLRYGPYTSVAAHATLSEKTRVH